jgi:hypothetical protein
MANRCELSGAPRAPAPLAEPSADARRPHLRRPNASLRIDPDLPMLPLARPIEHTLTGRPQCTLHSVTHLHQKHTNTAMTCKVALRRLRWAIMLLADLVRSLNHGGIGVPW